MIFLILIFLAFLNNSFAKPIRILNYRTNFVICQKPDKKSNFWYPLQAQIHQNNHQILSIVNHKKKYPPILSNPWFDFKGSPDSHWLAICDSQELKKVNKKQFSIFLKYFSEPDQSNPKLSFSQKWEIDQFEQQELIGIFLLPRHLILATSKKIPKFLNLPFFTTNALHFYLWNFHKTQELNTLKGAMRELPNPKIFQYKDFQEVSHIAATPTHILLISIYPNALHESHGEIVPFTITEESDLVCKSDLPKLRKISFNIPGSYRQMKLIEGLLWIEFLSQDGMIEEKYFQLDLNPS